MKKYYVYELLDNEIPFYVGKGCGQRMFHHVNCVKRGKIPNGNNYKLFYKIREMLVKNVPIQYKQVYFTDIEKEALEYEIKHIDSIGISNLLNISLGGDSFGKLSSEIEQQRRNNISKSTKGKKKHSLETIQKLREKFTGKNNPSFGLKRSEEVRRLLSKQKIGNKNPAKRKDVRLKISKSHKGMNMGIKSPCSKLTNEQICCIRKLKGLRSQYKIAREFNVCQKTISKIQRNESYII